MHTVPLEDFAKVIVGISDYGFNKHGSLIKKIHHIRPEDFITTTNGQAFITLALSFISTNSAYDLNGRITSDDLLFNNRTLLYIAASNKATPIAIFKALLELPDANYNEPQPDNMTPLLGAAQVCDLPKFKVLLTKDGIDTDAVDDQGDTVLHMLAKHHAQDSFIQVLDCDARPINQINMRGEAPLHGAAQEGLIRCVIKILEQDNTTINHQNQHGETPLHLAIKHRRIEAA